MPRRIWHRTSEEDPAEAGLSLYVPTAIVTPAWLFCEPTLTTTGKVLLVAAVEGTSTLIW